MINETAIATETLKASIYNPSILLVWIATVLVFIVMTYAFKSKNINWGNFVYVVLFTLLISGTIVYFTINSPDSVSQFFNQTKEFLRI